VVYVSAGFVYFRKKLRRGKKRFGEVVQIFFEETTKKDTLEDVLEELGWRKVQTIWRSPVLVYQTLIKGGIVKKCRGG
jgi:hypothetical protein